MITLPRGVRNNNPGNIRLSSAIWQGEVKGKDAEFETFKTPEDGLRALMKVLLNYQRKYGLNTVQSIINRWAPPNENATDHYITSVCKRVGVKRDQSIDMLSRKTLVALAKAIVLHENGKPPAEYPAEWYAPEIYDAAARRCYESAGIKV